MKLALYARDLSLFVPASNCCPIEECHTLCLVYSHPTILGWIVIGWIVIASVATMAVISGWLSLRKGGKN